MPRTARKIGNSGIYHIMVRGINRQDIFEDDEDIERFLHTIKRYKEVSKFEIYAYCIMSNHVHLLMKEIEEPISIIIKRISGSYVFWYNKKYERCGHLFQERYKSEAVDNDEYFLTVLRYIHQNPIKAGIVQEIYKYKWSSYSQYIKDDDMIDIDFVLEIFSRDRAKAIEVFKAFNNQNSNDSCLEYDEKVRISDTELRDFILNLGIKDAGEIKVLDKKKKDEVLKKLKAIDGVTIRQLSRVTGISKSVIDRV